MDRGNTCLCSPVVWRCLRSIFRGVGMPRRLPVLLIFTYGHMAQFLYEDGCCGLGIIECA